MGFRPQPRRDLLNRKGVIRMRRTILMAIMASTLSGGALAAQQDDRHVGSFLIHSEKDKFSDNSTVIAAAESGDNGLILRCLQDTRNVALFVGGERSNDWSRGDTGKIKVKIDDKPVQTLNVGAVNDKVLQLQDSEDLLDLMHDAREVAMRLTINDVTSDYDFQLQQTAKVVDEINKGCGVNK